VIIWLNIVLRKLDSKSCAAARAFSGVLSRARIWAGVSWPDERSETAGSAR
jgi:hypothetical protein